MPQVISIQSQVVHGHVGNSAAVYPMQASGLDVAAVPTALLSNHPHYPSTYGRILDAGLLADLLRGVEDRGLVESAAVLLTGWLGSEENADVVAGFIARARARNPGLRVVCDPVMGDDDLGIFVDPALVEMFRDRLVPLADIITPNQFELELLAGSPARGAPDLVAALSAIRLPGQAAAVTGCRLEDTPAGQIETLAFADGHLSRSAVERVPIRPCGTGDLFTALLVAGICAGANLPAASAAATRTILEILRRTRAEGAGEMRITGFPFAPNAAGGKEA